MYNKNLKKQSISTFGIKIFFLIALFFGFPYLLISSFSKYQENALGIIEQQNTIVEIQSDKNDEIKVLTKAEAETLAEIHKFIVGTWITEFDGRYKIVIEENNKFEEYYDEVKEGFGVWRVFSGVRESVNLSNSPNLVGDIDHDRYSPSILEVGSTTSVDSAYTKSEFENQKVEDPKYFFQKQQFEEKHKGEIYIYQIQQLDLEKFVLVFKSGAGKPLIFVRATSTQDQY
jgi:uncharacterized protein (UPF0333 family)